MPNIQSDTDQSPLWSVDVERDFVEPSMLAMIFCREGCGFSERAFFGIKNRKVCPKCQKSNLGVNEFNHRNSVVADKTERFALQCIHFALATSPELADRYFVKRGVVCPELGLTGRSGADLAILRTDLDGSVPADVIACLFEVKMSVIWNWHEMNMATPHSDYDCHGGRPSVFRTDSILKAIGKAAITRSHRGSEGIPFVVIGNTPPPITYRDKVDGTVRAGLIQKWISLTPNPLIVQPDKLPDERNPKSTTGFLRIDDVAEFQRFLITLLDTKWQYVGAMANPEEVGNLIKSLNLARSSDEIGQEFLERLPDATSASVL